MKTIFAGALLCICVSGCCVSLAATVKEVQTSSSTVASVAQTKETVKAGDAVSQRKAKESKHGSAIASDRLMRELKRAHKSELYKKGLYSIELVNESLYEWRVKLFADIFDSKTILHSDLVEMSKTVGKNYVELNLSYDDDYPFSPPFVRLVYPVFKSRGGGLFGGALCMDTFSPQVSFSAIVQSVWQNSL